MGRLTSVLLLALCVAQLSGTGFAWGGNDKVKLNDVQVLTLYTGAMTTGRRSSPVPQLRCVGGSANGAFVPQTVQCYNKGSDGYDVQWECKTDMDNAYKFGKISVTCEGYDYPDDPYVLKGSCGLEYTLDYTGSGNAQHSQQHGGSSDYGWNSNVYPKAQKQGDFVTNLACGAVVVVIVYAIYKTCITPNEQTRQRSNTNDDYPRRPGPGTGSSSPPPPGFRSDYGTGNDGGYASGGDSCHANSQGSSSGSGMGRNAGGFWTGAAAGGLLGYMFGNRNNNATYQGAYYRPSTSRGWGGGSSWGGGSGSWGSSSSGSSGSRSASGFGGTSRR
ncbi:Store-operated calcium entry-associated regulatory factor [Orchesella cincta]|uniref:Store-operated calcium entry-associated regulatory factor n=1 Tax=Orchesella cincta TaxID=48709 RepID=A0A1D2N1N0_ORCCI|nr:Store-operated calcium entry-associated regulatory factor [Orchesella cincta]